MPVEITDRKALASKLLKAVDESGLTRDSDGWYCLPLLAPRIKDSGFLYTSYGFKKLKPFLEYVFGDEVEFDTGATGPSRIRIKRGDKPATATKETTKAAAVKPIGSSRIKTSIDEIAEDYVLGDAIRISTVDMGTLEGFIVDMDSERIKLQPYDTNKPYSIRGAYIRNWGPGKPGKNKPPVIKPKSPQKPAKAPEKSAPQEKKTPAEKHDKKGAQNTPSPEKPEESTVTFGSIDREITELLKLTRQAEAIEKLDGYISHAVSKPSLLSKLLRRKAQIFSSMRMTEEATEVYRQLIELEAGRSVSSNPRNMCHLYTEMARTQLLVPGGLHDAISSLEAALGYEPDSTVASALLEKARSVEAEGGGTEKDEEEFLMDDTGVITVSTMLSEDMKAHNFASQDILKNNGIPTPEIAHSMYIDLTASRDKLKADRYPLYLEIAKAYQMLPAGTYDYNEYLSALAFYAVLKGNFLYSRLQQALDATEGINDELTALADSATSYYIESLSLLENNRAIPLGEVLTNSLRVNAAIKARELGISHSLPKDFSQLFSACVTGKSAEMKEIGWETVLEVGSVSVSAWNSLFRQRNGSGVIYAQMKRQKERNLAFRILHRLTYPPVAEGSLESEPDFSKSPGIFLKECFARRKREMDALVLLSRRLGKMPLEPERITPLREEWDKVLNYIYLLKPTDRKSYEAAKSVIGFLTPYINRPRTERSNLLIQSLSLINAQMKYIRENTTYYGRVLFYPLFERWGADIQKLLDRQVAETLPSLSAYPDPPYITDVNGSPVVNLVIDNSGPATADEYEMEINLRDASGKLLSRGVDRTPCEVPASTKVFKIMNLPPSVSGLQHLEVSMQIVPIYQGKKCPARQCEFSVEREPAVTLTYDRVPWKDGAVPGRLLFKGRMELLSHLQSHYTSPDRDKSYILYGLTRTGKSTILKYLSDAVNGTCFMASGQEKKICCIRWDMSQAASHTQASDMWGYLITDCIADSLEDELDDLDFGELPDKVRFKDFQKALDIIARAGYHPLFLVDEFSFIKSMIDKGLITSAFLHQLRQVSLDDKASFIFAGTYDIKALLGDEKYGITGQLVNTREYQVSEIDRASAEELIRVLEPDLTFSKDAIDRIHALSGDIPYFIQIICKYCGYYAVEHRRATIGFGELEKVVAVLTGEIPKEAGSHIEEISANQFQNNMIGTDDPHEVTALLSSICHLNRDNTFNPRGVSVAELEELWAKNGIEAFRPLLSPAITMLAEKRILARDDTDEYPTYRLSVDIFRRWWRAHHLDLNLELNPLKK